MILPIRTSIRPLRTPYANYGLIIINILVFFATYWPHKVGGGSEVLRSWASAFMLIPARPFLWQYVSYAFLHAGLMHIFGNMYFLYLFGNNVNDKLGNVGYIAFYMAGAVFSGIGHSLVSTSPVLGASGAVAAVTGAYLVLFPKTFITIFYWLFFFIGQMELPALYFIALKLIVIDNLLSRTANVAYDAHLAGYAFGIAAMMLLLATNILPGSGVDMWLMIKQWNRRRRFKGMVSGGYDPFAGQHGHKKFVNAREVKTKEPSPADRRLMDLRAEISNRMAERNLSAAADMYIELIRLDKDQVPPKQYLLDIANQLASEGRHTEAAEAYGRFLKHYPGYEHSEQVELMLGIILSRYLKDRRAALKFLQRAQKKLTDPGQLKLCDEEIQRLSGD